MEKIHEDYINDEQFFIDLHERVDRYGEYLAIEAAKERGDAKGIEIGASDKAREIAKGMKEEGINTETIVKLSGLTIEEVEAL